VLLIAAGVAAIAMGPVPSAPRQRGRYVWNWRAPLTWLPLGYGFMDRFSIGVFVSTFTLFLVEVHGLSAVQRGVLIALFMLPFAVLCYPAGRLAQRRGWLVPMLVGNILFGVVFAAYGIVPPTWLPAAMVLSGICSALMFAPNLLLISDLARMGHGEGLFGAFQVAGSLGFLTGPIAGGMLVAATRRADGTPAYAAIFAGVGSLELVLAVASLVMLRSLARQTAPLRSSLAAADG
jgi:MFS family permease